MQNPTDAPPGRGRSGGKVAAIVAASLIAFLSLGLLAAGGGLLYGDAQKDEQGYISTDKERFTTDTYALATENLDVDVDGLDSVVADDALGKVRVKVTSNESKPAFVGIARTSDVSRYLAGTSHAVVQDIDSSPFAADYRTLDGDRTPASPASQDFWAALTKRLTRSGLSLIVDSWVMIVMPTVFAP